MMENLQADPLKMGYRQSNLRLGRISGSGQAAPRCQSAFCSSFHEAKNKE